MISVKVRSGSRSGEHISPGPDGGLFHGDQFVCRDWTSHALQSPVAGWGCTR